MHTLAGNPQALDVLQGMARLDRGLGAAPGRRGDGAHPGARVRRHERGALQPVGGDRRSRGTATSAHRFDHERIFGPLAAGHDELKGLHVNTTIPKIIGAARRYELTGEPRYRDVAEYFWREVSTRRAYCTGGTSNGESWNTEPGVLAAELASETQECCTSYNMLKLTRHVFGWTADPARGRLLRAAAVERRARHPAPGGRREALLRAAGLGLLEAVRHAAPRLLVLHRDRQRVRLEVRRQHLLPRRRRRVGQPVHRLGSGLGGERRAHRAGHALPGLGRHLAGRPRRPADASRPQGARARVDARRERGPERPHARGLRGARRLLRGGPHLEGRRPARSRPADGAARAGDARRPDGAGRDVRAAGAGGEARHRRHHGCQPPCGADEAADGARVHVPAARRRRRCARGPTIRRPGFSG